jgi:hypothetical protein
MRSPTRTGDVEVVVDRAKAAGGDALAAGGNGGEREEEGNGEVGGREGSEGEVGGREGSTTLNTESLPNAARDQPTSPDALERLRGTMRSGWSDLHTGQAVSASPRSGSP